MTSLSPKEFKEELRGRITDFAVSGYLISSSVRKPKEKEKQVEEMYLKLEKWIMEQLYPMIEEEVRLVTPEDIIENGFTSQYTHEEHIEPDTNNSSMFPAEGNDMLDF